VSFDNENKCGIVKTICIKRNLIKRTF